MLLVAALPVADVLKAAVSRRSLSVRLLVLIACLAACRRGRAVMSYAVWKVFSPITFLLWCLGTRRRRDGNNRLLQAGAGGGKTPQRRRGGWRGAIGKRALIFGIGDSLRESPEHEGPGTAVPLAALGESGRLAAFDKLRELRREGACCDVTLAVGGRQFKAHKCVLAAQSFPLRAMFEGAFKEGREDVIALRDVDPSSFALLLDFWYDGNVEITAENVEALLDLSARYGVSLLRRRCCAFVARSATPSTACSLLAVADRYDCRRLKRDLLAYTLQCFPLACCDSGSSDGFSHLPLTLVAEVLMDDRLNTGSSDEVAVFWAAVSWLEADRCRRRNADEVLSHVRFGLVSAKTLAEVVEAHELVQTKAGKAFVHEAYRYQALPPESRGEFAASMSARARPRAAADAIFTAGGGSSCGRGGEGRGGGRFRTERVSSSFGVGLGTAVVDEDGFYSDEGENEPGRRASGLEARAHPAPAADDEGGVAGGGNQAPAAPFSGCDVEEMRQEEECGRAVGEGASPTKPHAPTRRSWGAGLRMYV